MLQRRQSMAISKKRMAEAITAIASVPGVEMSIEGLFEDVLLLTYAFSAEGEFMVAVASTCSALMNLAADKVTPSSLKYGYRDWLCFHYQHRAAQGARADMRIMYRRFDGGIRVHAFGHRNLPQDFYERLAQR